MQTQAHLGKIRLNQVDGDMRVWHTAYGLSLSSDLAVPGLVCMPPQAAVDLQLWWESVPSWVASAVRADEVLHYVSPWQDPSGHSLLRIWKLDGDRYFRFRYADGTEFIVDRQGTRVWAQWPSDLTIDDTATYFLGPILGFILVLRGITCLHASAIAINQRAVLFVGPRSAGKSTLAGAFANLGLPILTDDVAALGLANGDVLVYPGYPRLRLWSDSVQMLYGLPQALPPLTPNWDKCYLDLTATGYRFQEEALPVSTIYVLGERSSNPRAPFVEAMAPADRLMALVGNTYAAYIKDAAIQAYEFSQLGQVTSQIPIRQIIPHQDPGNLGRLCRLVLDDSQRQAPC